MDTSIFKAYDVRGVYPQTMNKHIAYSIGYAFSQIVGGDTVCIGSDMRLSGPEVKQGLVQGLNAGGMRVVDIGLVSTDMVTFAVGKFQYDGGIMITASHNPSEYNGMKMVGKHAVPISSNHLLFDIRDYAAQVDHHIETPLQSIEKDIWEDWVDHVLQFVHVDKIKPLKIVVDAGNGMGGKVIEYFQKALPQLTIEPLYFELDGSFPNHQPSPIEDHNTQEMRNKVLELEYDCGMAFDGDADRVFLCDEQGEIIWGTEMTAMIAESLLLKYPQETILYNAICGWIVPETIQKYGAISKRTQVGHSLIKQDMAKTGAIFAGEHSGHYYFRDNYRADSAIIAALVVLDLLSQSSEPLSSLVRNYKKYYASGEINSHVENIPQKLEAIKEKYCNAKSIDTLDGVSVWYDTYWFNVRPSNTEPLLRLNVEAKDHEQLQQVTKEILHFIRS